MAGDPGREAIDRRGFGAVDGQPDPAYLVATMEETDRWPSVRHLRAWELDRLALGPGDAVLDVGCGIGAVVRSFAPLVQPGGRVVGIDASSAMLEVARERAAEVGVDVVLRVGDANAVDEPDDAFDACRCERVLQWLDDPEGAVAEMVRVVRPGGRLCLTDTDWRTFTVDLPDRARAARFTDAMVAYRGAGAAAGGRLLDLGCAAGLTGIEHTRAVHRWTEWDPDTQPGPPGLFPLRDVLDEVVADGSLDADDALALADQLARAARAGDLGLSVGMTSVFGCVARPAPPDPRVGR